MTGTKRHLHLSACHESNSNWEEVAAEFSTCKTGRNSSVKNATYSPSKYRELDRCFSYFSVNNRFVCGSAEIFSRRKARVKNCLAVVLFFPDFKHLMCLIKSMGEWVILKLDLALLLFSWKFLQIWGLKIALNLCFMQCDIWTVSSLDRDRSVLHQRRLLVLQLARQVKQVSERKWNFSCISSNKFWML